MTEPELMIVEVKDRDNMIFTHYNVTRFNIIGQYMTTVELDWQGGRTIYMNPVWARVTKQ